MLTSQYKNEPTQASALRHHSILSLPSTSVSLVSTSLGHLHYIVQYTCCLCSVSPVLKPNHSMFEGPDEKPPNILPEHIPYYIWPAPHQSSLFEDEVAPITTPSPPITVHEQRYSEAVVVLSSVLLPASRHYKLVKPSHTKQGGSRRFWFLFGPSSNLASTQPATIYSSYHIARTIQSQQDVEPHISRRSVRPLLCRR